MTPFLFFFVGPPLRSRISVYIRQRHESNVYWCSVWSTAPNFEGHMRRYQPLTFLRKFFYHVDRVHPVIFPSRAKVRVRIRLKRRRRLTDRGRLL